MLWHAVHLDVYGMVLGDRLRIASWKMKLTVCKPLDLWGSVSARPLLLPYFCWPYLVALAFVCSTLLVAGVTLWYIVYMFIYVPFSGCQLDHFPLPTVWTAEAKIKAAEIQIECLKEAVQAAEGKGSTLACTASYRAVEAPCLRTVCKICYENPASWMHTAYWWYDKMTRSCLFFFCCPGQVMSKYILCTAYWTGLCACCMSLELLAGTEANITKTKHAFLHST